MQITLANLKEATAKQVFEHVKTHMLKQNAKSLSDKGNCAYRGEGGLMCAAGCLISDAEYGAIKIDSTDSLDAGGGKNWGWLADERYVPKAHGRLISDLQIVHDTVEVAQWAHHLELIAINHDLED